MKPDMQQWLLAQLNDREQFRDVRTDKRVGPEARAIVRALEQNTKALRLLAAAVVAAAPVDVPVLSPGAPPQPMPSKLLRRGR